MNRTGTGLLAVFCRQKRASEAAGPMFRAMF
jgi:hypothetical protein